ncbi:MAG: DNA alkylation repair protein [Bacilli bacterium]|nr:DNA alkylation repair protein [Bacilli bacterium]
MKKYIAYGSNLNLEMMKNRLGKVNLYSKEKLENYRLVCDRYLSVIKTKNNSIDVGVFLIDDEDERLLDEYEDYPWLYKKEYIDDKLIYIKNEIENNDPTNAYVDCCLKGYQDFGFNDQKLKASFSVAKFRKIFKENENIDYVLKYQKYLKDQFKSFGIDSNKRRLLTKEFIKEQKKLDIDLLQYLYYEQEREFHYLALDIFQKCSKYITYEDLLATNFLIRQNSWWDSVDMLHRVYGEVSLKDERVKNLMLKFAESKNLWERRVAILFQLKLKAHTDVTLLEKIILLNLNSNEFFINKAIGWALREYSYTDKKWVINFLNQYQHQLNPLTIREASKHLYSEK